MINLVMDKVWLEKIEVCDNQSETTIHWQMYGDVGSEDEKMYCLIG